MAARRAALARKVKTVPGDFFAVNPGRSLGGESPLRSWVRFSCGPPEDDVRLGLARLAEVVRAAASARSAITRT